MHCVRRTTPQLRVVAVLVALSALLVASGPAGAGKKEELEPMPAEVALTTLDGETVTFGELRGKAVLLDFWATWCKPCHASLPTLRRLHERIEKKELPVVILSVSVDHNREALERFVEEEGMEWTQVWDRGAQFSREAGVSSYPYFVILDHEGRPVSSLRGWSSRHDLSLARMVTREAKRARKAARKAAEGEAR